MLPAIGQVNKFWGRDRGGIEAALHATVTDLDRRGFPVSVLACRPRCSRARPFPPHVDGRELEAPVIASMPVHPGFPRALARLESQCDLLHFHLPFPLAEAAALRLPKRIPWIATFHAEVLGRNPLIEWAQRSVTRRFLHRVDCVVVSSPASSEAARWSDGGQRVRAIPFGFDLDPFEAASRRRRRNAARETASLVFLGRLVPYKGLDVLLRALPALPARLQIIGDGAQRPGLERLVRDLGLCSRVEFLGHLPDREIPECLAAGDIFVLPSRTQAETFGVAQVEAMAAGLPVVNTALATGTDWVSLHGVTGLTVAPGDPAALHCALREMIENREFRLACGLRARVRARELFSLERRGAEMAGLYEELLEEFPLPRPLTGTGSCAAVPWRPAYTRPRPGPSGPSPAPAPRRMRLVALRERDATAAASVVRMRLRAALRAGVKTLLAAWDHPRPRASRGSASEKSEPVRTLLLVHWRRFGDILAFWPAIDRLRALYPGAHLTWMVHRRYARFVAEAGVADAVWSPRWRGLALLGPRPRFDLAMVFHDSRVEVSTLLGRRHARCLAGFAAPGARRLLDIAPDAPPGNILDRYLFLMEAAAGTRSVSLSAARSTLRPRLAPRWEQAARPALEAIRQSARNDFGRLHAPLRKPHFLILHPGCGTRSKQWPASYWTKLIELCQALGRPLVLTGSAQERSLCARIIEPAPSSHPVLNLAGQTDWGMLAGIVAAADALVAPDTGVIHLAHALGTPSVALFGPIDPALWGYQSTRHRSLAHRLPCSFCREAACALVPGAQPSPCMEAITPAEVWDELQRLLEPHSARMAAAACTNFSMPSPNTASGGNRLATR